MRSATAADISWSSDSAAGRVVLTPANTIHVRPVRWLWTLRLALGTLGLLGGREGIGKSILAYTLAAEITRGLLDGVYVRTPRSVIVAATEDSWEYTIVPRLMAAGADLARVFRVDVTTADTTESSLSLPRDLVGLERAAVDVGAALIILDPLLSRLDSNLDSHKDAEVRRALEPLVTLADRTAASVLGLIHVSKSVSNDPLTTLMASRAFAAVARTVLFVMQDPDDDGGRLLGTPKNNLGRTDLPTLGFRIDGAKVADTLEGEVWTGRLVWTGESSRSIREALESTSEAAGDKSATSEAADWLGDYLASQDGAVDSAIIKREGSKAGHSKDALRRAKHRLGVTSVTSGFPRRAFWSLPVGASAGRHTTTAPTAPTAPTVPGETSQTHTLYSVDAVDSVDAVVVPLQSGAPTDATARPPAGISAEAWARHHERAVN
jgi:AAA domain